MKPWILLDTARIPDGGALRLLQRDTEFSIRLDQLELMNSRVRGSEEALGTLACAGFTAQDAPRILIGGLGMGFTLRAVRDRLGPRARIVVAELVPAVVAWGRGPLAHLCAESLADPRVTIAEADVVDLIRSARSQYDAILLDVDNGPYGLTRELNQRLYSARGLAAQRLALRPGGLLAVWSASPDTAFTQRLHRAGFDATEHSVRARGTRGPRHTIWIAAPGHPSRPVATD